MNQNIFVWLIRSVAAYITPDSTNFPLISGALLISCFFAMHEAFQISIRLINKKIQIQH